MGLIMWLVAGAAAGAGARVIRTGRPGRWAAEVLIAVAGAVIFGITATALDFGGWKEPDWRAGVFSLLGAFALVGILRAVRTRR